MSKAGPAIWLFKGDSKSDEVLLNGTEAVMVLTWIILNSEPCEASLAWLGDLNEPSQCNYYESTRTTANISCKPQGPGSFLLVIP